MLHENTGAAECPVTQGALSMHIFLPKIATKAKAVKKLTLLMEKFFT